MLKRDADQLGGGDGKLLLGEEHPLLGVAIAGTGAGATTLGPQAARSVYVTAQANANAGGGYAGGGRTDRGPHTLPV